MKRSKIIIRSVSLLLIILLTFTMAACSQPKDSGEKPNKKSTAELTYADKLFDNSYVHMVDIAISEDDWADLQKNPTSKTKYKTDITIDGETISGVSFATKGNTSLTAVAKDEDSSRYSFKVNFGKYTEGQTYYGLNKLSLNNLYADATYMKDYLSYEIFRQAGVESPLVSYVWLTINGEDHGLYIAIEDVSESYLERTNEGEGELYKPETSQLANMDQAGGREQPENMPDGDIPQPGGEMPQPGEDMPQPGGEMPQPGGEMPWSGGEMPQPGGEMPQPGEDMPQPGEDMPWSGGEMPWSGGEMPQPGGEMPQPGGKMPGGLGSASSGADLKYTDDSIDSYSDIFDNDETDADDASKERVIAALKALSAGENIEAYVDTDEVIRYFAAHNFVLNYDSYTGSMLHNYYLYEKDGKLSMLPWDYNLAFGAFAGGGQGGADDATDLVNTGIDTPLSGSQESDRPMWNFISSNEEYLKRYHQAYDQLLTYFESGSFDEEIDRLYEMLLPYIEKDTSAFYTAEEFQTACATIRQFCCLRAESIRKQLTGTLSTKTAEQNAEDKVDASSIKIRDMGGMKSLAL